jgi:uncharacterized protein YciI
MFIITLSYLKPLSEVDQHIESHITYLEKYYRLGKFLISGRKVPRTGGVILARCESLQEANEIVAEDPFFIAKVAKYDIIEMIPTMTSVECEFFKSLV